MPLRCVDDTGDRLLAFDLTPADWTLLAERNRRQRHLRMPCCGAEVSLRRSKLGTQFFAHKKVGSCVTAPETEGHLRLKQLAVEVARSRGWDAETEVTGRGANGEPWRADVLARRGDARIAIEIQWSSQTDEETLRRQERYRQSGVRGLWLIRHGGFPLSNALPAAQLIEASDGYLAELPQKFVARQSMPVRAYLEAAFDRRLRFGLPVGETMVASILTGSTTCWHDSCRAETTIVTGIHIQVGAAEHVLTLSRFEDFPDLFAEIAPHVPADRGIGAIKHRYSRTLERSYLSNGCVACDRLMGQFFEHDAWDDGEIVAEFPLTLSERWRRAILGEDGEGEYWWVAKTSE